MSPSDYYHILGVKRDASTEEIKKAYRRLAREHHPDMTKGDKAKEAKFKEINEAYEVLSDPQKRRVYDQFGHAGTHAGAGAGFGGWGGFSQSGFDFSQFDMGSQWSSIFESFFGRHGGTATRTPHGPQRGRDLEITLNLSFKEAVFGCERKFQVTAPSVCSACKGKGYPVGAELRRCGACGGSGQVRRVQQSIFGQVMQTIVCEHCDGAGEMPDQNCGVCHGRGRVRTERTVQAKIPAGVDTGSIVRVTKAGEAGLKGGPPGDLYIHVVAESSLEFQRQGSDIYSELSLAIPQAVLGDELTIETVHGPVTLKIPAGINSGKLLRLRGKGVRVPGSSKIGDHLVRVLISMPQRLSKTEAELYIKLAKEAGIKLKPQAKGNWFKELFD